MEDWGGGFDGEGRFFLGFFSLVPFLGLGIGKGGLAFPFRGGFVFLCCHPSPDHYDSPRVYVMHT